LSPGLAQRLRVPSDLLHRRGLLATRLKDTDLSAARYLDNWSRSVRRGHWDVWEIATAREYLATYWIEYVEAPAAGWQAALRCSWAARNPHHLTRT
jgi:hypothetical protein